MRQNKMGGYKPRHENAFKKQNEANIDASLEPEGMPPAGKVQQDAPWRNHMTRQQGPGSGGGIIEVARNRAQAGYERMNPQRPPMAAQGQIPQALTDSATPIIIPAMAPQMAPVMAPQMDPQMVGLAGMAQGMFPQSANDVRQQIMGLPADLAGIQMAPMSMVRSARRRRGPAF